MTNSSLHTKYRPAALKQVVGHEDTVAMLRSVLKGNRAHAFILTGPAGVGKTSIARIIANEICGGEANAANIEEVPAAVSTGVDAMRQLIEKTQYKAIGARSTKVMIVDEAHRLSGQAWDSLLKAIEEPSPHVYWIFVTTNSGKIPQTIKTRCIHCDLKPLSEDDLLKILKRVNKREELEVSDDILELIAESSGGSARRALVYLETCLYCESVKEARQALKNPGESKEVVDLARFLITPQGRNWKSAMNIVNALKDEEAESIRIVLMNYFAVVAANAKTDKDGIKALQVMGEFSEPYNPSEKFAPLLLSIGRVIFG